MSHQASLLYRTLTALFAALMLFSAHGTVAQSSEQVRIERDLDRLAALPNLQASDTDRLFSHLRFSPNMPMADWRRLSALDQLTIAYNSAQAAEVPQGDRVVAETARFLAERYESVEFDPRLQPLLTPERPTQEPISYGRPAPGRALEVPPLAIRNQLDRLALYVEGAHPLGRVAVLKRTFGLRSPELERALRHRDPKRMLRTAITLAAPPPTQSERVRNLARDVSRFTDAGTLDASIQELLRERAPPMEAPSAVSADSGAGGGGGGGGSPARVEEAARRNASFDADDYRTESARTPSGQGRPTYTQAQHRTFSRAISRARGRGGVVLGAPVTAAASIGRPTRVWIEMGGQSCRGEHPERVWGELRVAAGAGAVYVYGPIPCDELVAAKRVVFDAFTDMPAWRPGEAIGLVTVDFPSSGRVELPPRNEEAMVFKMLLHPALVDLDVGRAVAFCDLLPAVRVHLLRSAGQDVSVATWIAELSRYRNWRWHERETHLVADGDQLRVSTTDTQSGSVLDVLAIAESGAADQPDKLDHLRSFAPAAAVLTEKVAEYRRLDSFMRTAAVLRWAKTNGANFVGRVPDLSAPRPKTPDYIGFDPGGEWIVDASASMQTLPSEQE